MPRHPLCAELDREVVRAHPDDAHTAVGARACDERDAVLLPDVVEVVQRPCRLLLLVAELHEHRLGCADGDALLGQRGDGGFLVRERVLGVGDVDGVGRVRSREMGGPRRLGVRDAASVAAWG